MTKVNNIASKIITGVVTSVYSKEGEIRCDVSGFRVDSTYTKVVVPSRYRFEAPALQEGDKVTIKRTDQGIWILDEVLSVDKEALEALEEKEYLIQFDQNTRIKVEKQNDDTFRVYIDSSENVEVEAQGDINISAPNGDVFIDEGGTTKKVATEDHTHPYDWTDPAGSGTTGLPSDITEVELE